MCRCKAFRPGAEQPKDWSISSILSRLYYQADTKNIPVIPGHLFLLVLNIISKLQYVVFIRRYRAAHLYSFFKGVKAIIIILSPFFQALNNISCSLHKGLSQFFAHYTECVIEPGKGVDGYGSGLQEYLKKH